MAKRAHWTTEEVLDEVFSDQESADMIAGDREEVDLDEDEPCMEGSDDSSQTWRT